jgi:hypothetical protein
MSADQLRAVFIRATRPHVDHTSGRKLLKKRALSEVEELALVRHV